MLKKILLWWYNFKLDGAIDENAYLYRQIQLNNAYLVGYEKSVHERKQLEAKLTANEERIVTIRNKIDEMCRRR